MAVRFSSERKGQLSAVWVCTTMWSIGSFLPVLVQHRMSEAGRQENTQTACQLQSEAQARDVVAAA